MTPPFQFPTNTAPDAYSSVPKPSNSPSRNSPLYRDIPPADEEVWGSTYCPCPLRFPFAKLPWYLLPSGQDSSPVPSCWECSHSPMYWYPDCVFSEPIPCISPS